MNTVYAMNQKEAINKVIAITEEKKPEYIRMVKQENGRYLITWEKEQN